MHGFPSSGKRRHPRLERSRIEDRLGIGRAHSFGKRRDQREITAGNHTISGLMGSNWELIAVYAAIFAGLFAFGLLINGVLLRFVKTLGMKNQNGTQVRWSSDTKPAIGGLSFYIVFLL